MKARGECAPYRYPQEVLGPISRLVLASKKAAGTEMDVVVAANLNLSTDGMTYLALHCQRNGVTLLENPMALRHLPEQGEARKEFSQPLGFGGDYHVLEDFAQGIKNKAGTVLTPDAGRIGGMTMLARTANLAKEAKLKVAPVVQTAPYHYWLSHGHCPHSRPKSQDSGNKRNEGKSLRHSSYRGRHTVRENTLESLRFSGGLSDSTEQDLLSHAT